MRNHLCTAPFCFSDWQYRIFSTKGTFPFPHRKRYFHACNMFTPSTTQKDNSFQYRKRYFHACNQNVHSSSNKGYYVSIPQAVFPCMQPCVPEAPKTLGSEVKNDNRRIKPSKSTFFSVDTVSVFPKNKASAQ